MLIIELIKQSLAGAALVIENVDAETAKFRLSVCVECGYNSKAEVPRCNCCTCYINRKVWSKTNRSKERPNGEVTHCPLGKWNDAEIATMYKSKCVKNAQTSLKS